MAETGSKQGDDNKNSTSALCPYLKIGSGGLVFDTFSKPGRLEKLKESQTLTKHINVEDFVWFMHSSTLHNFTTTSNEVSGAAVGGAGLRHSEKLGVQCLGNCAAFGPWRSWGHNQLCSNTDKNIITASTALVTAEMNYGSLRVFSTMDSSHCHNLVLYTV